MLLVKQLILALIQDTCFICWWNVPYWQHSGAGGMCLLPAGSVHSPLLTLQGEHCSTAATHCTSLLCFCWESVCSFPPVLPQRQEMSQCLLFWLCELFLLYYLLWEEGRELSCSEEIRQRFWLHELLKLFLLLFVKNNNFESFSRILGDP